MIDSAVIEDGHGSVWDLTCPKCGDDSMYVVTVGRAECESCDAMSPAEKVIRYATELSGKCWHDLRDMFGADTCERCGEYIPFSDARFAEFEDRVMSRIDSGSARKFFFVDANTIMDVLIEFVGELERSGSITGLKRCEAIE